MKSKRQFFTIIVISVYLTLFITYTTFSQQTAGQLFEEALFMEEANGELLKAIALYNQILKKYPEKREVGAKAQLHIGLCYEKLGKTEAIKAYELVLQNYQNYVDEVQIASLRLSGLTKEDGQGLSVINPFEKGSYLHSATLSPDGTKLAGMDYSIGQNIAVYDRLSGQTKLITKYDWTPGSGWAYFPIWSHDGKEVVHMFADWAGSNCELQVSTLEGKTRTLIKNESNAGQIIPRQWSQDGSKILTFKQDTSGFYTIGFVFAVGGSFKALYKTQWKLQFTAGDASVASLSPDGKFVVIADGPAEKLDVFIIDADVGTPTVLSDHPANEYTVAWSPDGKHITFIRETQGGSLLYAVEMAGGKPVGQPFMIKEGMHNVGLTNWTEHGICYNSGLDIHDIYTLPLNPETGTPTGDPKPLDYTPTGSNNSPVWSHDGKYLAFVSWADLTKVVIMPADGGETLDFIIPASGFWAPSLRDLRWLPDNSGVSFHVLNNLGKPIVYRLDIITGKWQNWLLPIQGYTCMDWGPDENSFVYAKWNYDDSDVDVQDFGIHQFNIRTGVTQYIFKPEVDTFLTLISLKFSRDHEKLTFLLNNKNLMVLDLESGESTMLSQNLGSPTFSPDGQKILTFGKKYSINILSLEGEILQQYSLAKYFTSGTRRGLPDWSPDGKQLVFKTRKMEDKTYIMKNVLK